MEAEGQGEGVDAESWRTNHLPFPPLELATRVLQINADEDAELSYDYIGFGTRTSLGAILPPDFNFVDKRVLDFGCGAGRTLRHFIPEAQSGEFWGVDIDERSVDWLQENLCPPLHVAKGEENPPLPFEDGYFDLAWAISVFTHLPETSPDWLLELHRILKPGGLLMASYMGEHNSETLAGEGWDESRIGFNVLSHDRPWDAGGPMVLMSEWWMREHWGRAFEILTVIPEVHNQAWVLMRRRDVSLTSEELMRPSEDEREWASMRHNLRQVQRELALAHAELANARGRVHEMESSASWRATDPLRRLKSSIASRSSP